MLLAAGVTALAIAGAPCQTEAEIAALARDAGIALAGRIDGANATRFLESVTGPEADTILVFGLPGGERVILVAMLRGCTVGNAVVPAAMVARFLAPHAPQPEK